MFLIDSSMPTRLLNDIATVKKHVENRSVSILPGDYNSYSIRIGCNNKGNIAV